MVSVASGGFESLVVVVVLAAVATVRFVARSVKSVLRSGCRERLATLTVVWVSCSGDNSARVIVNHERSKVLLIDVFTVLLIDCSHLFVPAQHQHHYFLAAVDVT
uniref:Putative secreted protein n=1 Tax=Anopheles darlingi TaxID=43151 RepID=A0A2M4D9R4_ANODA